MRIGRDEIKEFLIRDVIFKSRFENTVSLIETNLTKFQKFPKICTAFEKYITSYFSLIFNLKKFKFSANTSLQIEKILINEALVMRRPYKSNINFLIDFLVGDIINFYMKTNESKNEIFKIRC